MPAASGLQKKAAEQRRVLRRAQKTAAYAHQRLNIGKDSVRLARRRLRHQIHMLHAERISMQATKRLAVKNAVKFGTAGSVAELDRLEKDE